MAYSRTYDWVTQEMFSKKLQEILDEEDGSTLLSIPGVAEIMSEYFNNEVLEKLEEERDENFFYAHNMYHGVELDGHIHT